MSKQTPKNRVLFMRRFIPALLVFFGVFSLLALNLKTPGQAYAATQSTINFQARLQAANGAIVPDGNYNVEFKLYSASSGGSALWTEDYYNNASHGIQTINGYVTANLGSVTAFPSTINWDQQLWLTMNIGGTTTGTPILDGEMSPRLQMTAVPYAFKAGQLAQANSGGTLFSSLSIQAPTVGNQNFVIQDQGAAGTYNLLTSGSGVQLQGSTPGTAQTGNFNISGTGIAGTLQAATIDTPSGTTTLNVGTTNATSGINLNQNVVVAAGKNIALSNASLTGIIITSQVTGEANPRFTVQANGVISWGGGTLAPDIVLSRASGTGLTLTANLQTTGLSVATVALPANIKFFVQPSSTTGTVEVLRGASGQTGDLMQGQDANGAVLGGQNASGGFYTTGVSSKFSALAVPAFTTSSTGSGAYYMITATNNAGETLGSTALGMLNSSATVAWTQVPGATGYKIYRNTTNSFTSGSLLRTTIINGTTVSFTDNGTATGAGLPPTTTAGTGFTLQSWAGQTGNAFQVQDSATNVGAAFTATGNQLTLGNATASGTSQGTIRFSDGTSDGFYGSLQLSGAIADFHRNRHWYRRKNVSYLG